MRLTRKDAAATVFVGTAAVLYGLWLTDTAVTGWSPRVLGAVVFGLGYAACLTTQTQMRAIYGPADRRPPMTYVVSASIIGGVALVAGIIAMAAGSKPMIAVLVSAMVVLWVASTVRHAIAGTRTPKLSIRSSAIDRAA